MKFISNRIVTKKVSLDDVIKSMKEPKEEKSLDEVLAGIKQGGQIKTASSEKKVKTASPEEKPVVEVKVDDSLQKEANLENLGDKKAPEFGKKDEDEGEVEETKDEDEGEVEETKSKDKDKDKDKKEGCTASSGKTLKIAKSCDFRSWTAEDVVKAWDQHGSVEKCAKNVKDDVSNPKMYCGLLQVASQVAKETIEKRANAKQGSPKVAKKPEKSKVAQKGVWKKLAKLTEKEKKMLGGYYRKLYGDKYVDSLLRDY